jgi:hypothetical protein
MRPLALLCISMISLFIPLHRYVITPLNLGDQKSTERLLKSKCLLVAYAIEGERERPTHMLEGG